VNGYAILKEDERGDRHNAKALGDGALLVHVALVDVQTVGHLFADGLNNRTKSAAGATPRGPEVDQDGLAGAGDNGVKISGGNCVCHGNSPSVVRC
jgi:hypothetical protein